jgi:hypothetical protein
MVTGVFGKPMNLLVQCWSGGGLRCRCWSGFDGADERWRDGTDRSTLSRSEAEGNALETVRWRRSQVQPNGPGSGISPIATAATRTSPLLGPSGLSLAEAREKGEAWAEHMKIMVWWANYLDQLKSSGTLTSFVR